MLLTFSHCDEGEIQLKNFFDLSDVFLLCAPTPQPGEIVFNTMKYRSSETVQRSGYKAPNNA